MSMIRYRGVGGSSSTATPYYGPAIYFDYTIQLEDDEAEIGGNIDMIRGTVEFVPKDSSELQDLRIRLEGYASCQLATSFDRRTIVTNEHRFLPDSTTNETYTSSLISQYFFQNWKPKKPEYKIVSNGIPHSFPFELHLRSRICLPASFESDFGKIYYKLSLYTYHDYKVAEKKVFVKGRLNLNQDPLNGRPLLVNWSRERSSGFLLPFRKRPFLKVTLVLNQRGFLTGGGDHLIFQLDVVNSSTEERMTKLSAFVVQKFIYFAKNETKITSTVLDQKHLHCQKSLDTMVQWEGDFEIGENLPPTFSTTGMKRRQQQQPIKILYCVQIIIELSGKPGFKGEAPIVIGMSRDSFVLGGARRPSDTGSICLSASSSRRSSLTCDTISLLSHPTFPPSYSGLPSRRVSCETLPPTYEEAFPDGEDKTGDDFEREDELDPDAEYWIRRNSNVV